MLEKKVQAVKAEKGISFVEARTIVSTESTADASSRSQPMAVVVRSGGGHQRPPTRSIYTQTDLTWPENKKTPSVTATSTCTSSQTDSSILEGVQ